MLTTDDASYMARALHLAERGRHTVSPNPVVGCVIVRDGTVVGEGFHQRAGGPHAEVVALQAAGDRAHGATVYVTLEPCDHTGRTGPCTAALIAARVSRVVAGVRDTDPRAAGGQATLRRAGIDTTVGVLEERARRVNEVHFHAVATQRPFVVGKAAASLDGRIAAADGTSRWLTGERARDRVQQLRAAADAVVIGSGTVLADDPQLTCRLDGYEGRPPLRVVLDRRGRVGPQHRVVDDSAPTMVLRDTTPHQVLATLWARDVRSVLVEGGAAVLHSFITAGLVDRLEVHVAPLLLGERGRPLVAGPGPATLVDATRFVLDTVEQLGDDAILTLSGGPGAVPLPEEVA